MYFNVWNDIDEIGTFQNIRNIVDKLQVQMICMVNGRPPLWSSGQGFWLQIQRSRVRFPALPDFVSGSGSGTGCTQPREPREFN